MMDDGTQKTSIKVLLADDHTLFRQGLAALLASCGGLDVVGETNNDHSVIELAQELQPDVIVMQVQVPLERAKDSLQRLREILPSLKIVICTMFEDPQYLSQFLTLGVSAYLVKSLSVEELIGTIRAVVFDPNGKPVVVGMPREMIEQAETGSDGVLSAREMEILALVSRGLSNREVASSLRLSASTVKRHLANIYPKMGVASRTAAVRKALQEGWITIQEVTQKNRDKET
jgi:DNA-binding NarL/FixJ family response regulator